MSAPSAERQQELVEAIFRSVDRRLASRLRQAACTPGISRVASTEQTFVIAGHRGTGKTRILPLVSELTDRPGLDLDAELERRSGKKLKDWVSSAPAEFRKAERELFESLPVGGVVSVGGGFLSHHPEPLAGHFVVVIPVSLETYRERMLADRRRPRLRPELSLAEEVETVFREREALHARFPSVGLEEWLRGYMAPGSNGQPA